jgi:hypothetical protein
VDTATLPPVQDKSLLMCCRFFSSDEGFIRYSLSRGWLWQGYPTDWKGMIETHGFEEAKVL